LDEICGGNSAYLDGLASKPDMGGIFSTEVSSDGSVADGYADATTTDDVAADLTNNWRGIAKLNGMGPMPIRENTMTVSAWRRYYSNSMNEESEHGNQRLNNLQFGAQDGEAGKSYGATKTALCRKRAAEKTAQTGATPEVKQKALNTLKTMKDNWNGIDAAETQYNAAKNVDKTIIGNKPAGTKRKNKLMPGGNGVFL
jgi:hypothetical protein